MQEAAEGEEPILAGTAREEVRSVCFRKWMNCAVHAHRTEYELQSCDFESPLRFMITWEGSV